MVVHSWINCTSCGHRFNSALPNCPKCNTSNKFAGTVSNSSQPGGRSKAKTYMIVVVAAVALFLVIGALASPANQPKNSSPQQTNDGNSVQRTEEPSSPSPDPSIGSSEHQKQDTSVIRAPVIGDFTIIPTSTSLDRFQMIFGLQDASGNTIPIAGMASVTIRDNKGTMVYEKELQVKAEEFQTYSWPSNNKRIVAYILDIPQGQIKQGSGNGIAYLTFRTADGDTLTATHKEIQIPQNENISRITRFSIRQVEDAYELQFGLLNVNNQEVSKDGEVLVSIVDNFNNLLYQKKLAVKKSDFSTLTASDDTQFYGKSWKFATSDVKSGLESGSARISFTSPEAAALFATANHIQIPLIPSQQAETIYRQKFLDTAESVNSTIEQEKIQVTLVRAGQYTHLRDPNGLPTDVVRNFRADFIITNTDTQSKVGPRYMDTFVLDNNGKKYTALSISYELGVSNSNGGNLYPYAPVKGFIEFDGMPNLAEPVKIIVKEEGSFLNKVGDILWEFPFNAKEA